MKSTQGSITNLEKEKKHSLEDDRHSGFNQIVEASLGQLRLKS